MAAEIDRPENRGYADNGIAEFKEAVARFMERQFGVELDPATEINHCIGSKTALAIFPATLINPGDVTLDDRAGLSGRRHAYRYYGGEVHRLPLLAENDFLPDLDSIPADILQPGEAAGDQLSEQPHGKVGHARNSSPGRWSSLPRIE